MVKNPHQLKKSSLSHRGFELVYRTLALPLMKFVIKRMGGDQIATEEVFSNTMMAVWKGWGTFEHKSSYFTWICRIALNKIADYYRKQINERSKFIDPTLDLLSELGSNELSNEERLVLEELRAAIRECLALLPKEKRRLLYLRYWKDMTLSKIAAVLGVSERAAEGKLYRARLEFRQVLAQKYPEYLS